MAGPAACPAQSLMTLYGHDVVSAPGEGGPRLPPDQSPQSRAASIRRINAASCMTGRLCFYFKTFNGHIYKGTKFWLGLHASREVEVQTWGLAQKRCEDGLESTGSNILSGHEIG